MLTERLESWCCCCCLCGFVRLVPIRSEFTTTDYLTVCWSIPLGVHSLTDSASALRFWQSLHLRVGVNEWTWCGELGLQLFCLFSVWMSMRYPPCASRLCRPLRRGRRFATAVMNLVSVHCLPFHLGWQTSGLARYHVLFFLSHQPVLHGAFSRGGDVTGQPSLVPLVKALMLTGRHSVLGLWGESRSSQRFI